VRERIHGSRRSIRSGCNVDGMVGTRPMLPPTRYGSKVNPLYVSAPKGHSRATLKLCGARRSVGHQSPGWVCRSGQNVRRPRSRARQIHMRSAVDWTRVRDLGQIRSGGRHSEARSRELDPRRRQGRSCTQSSPTPTQPLMGVGPGGGGGRGGHRVERNTHAIRVVHFQDGNRVTAPLLSIQNADAFGKLHSRDSGIADLADVGRCLGRCLHIRFVMRIYMWVALAVVWNGDISYLQRCASKAVGHTGERGILRARKYAQFRQHPFAVPCRIKLPHWRLDDCKSSVHRD